MREVRILPEVLQEIADSAEWYDSHGHCGLGDGFVTAFYDALKEIEQNGEIYRESVGEFRKVFIRPFRMQSSIGFTRIIGL